jgi:hypothetical protein
MKLIIVHNLQKAVFSPMKAAMLQAVKDGHMINWSGLTEDAINNHLKLTPARLGRQDPPRVCSRSGSRSTLHRPDRKVSSSIKQGKLFCDVRLHI